MGLEKSWICKIKTSFLSVILPLKCKNSSVSQILAVHCLSDVGCLYMRIQKLWSMCLSSPELLLSYSLWLKIKGIEKLQFWQDIVVLYSKLSENKICSHFNCYSSNYSVQGTKRKNSNGLFIVSLSHCTLDWKCTSLLKREPLHIILLSEEFINTGSIVFTIRSVTTTLLYLL